MSTWYKDIYDEPITITNKDLVIAWFIIILSVLLVLFLTLLSAYLMFQHLLFNKQDQDHLAISIAGNYSESEISIILQSISPKFFTLKLKISNFKKKIKCLH